MHTLEAPMVNKVNATNVWLATLSAMAIMSIKREDYRPSGGWLAATVRDIYFEANDLQVRHRAPHRLRTWLQGSDSRLYALGSLRSRYHVEMEDLLPQRLFQSMRSCCCPK